jgi:hypothetical protein
MLKSTLTCGAETWLIKQKDIYTLSAMEVDYLKHSATMSCNDEIGTERIAN